MPSKQSSGAKGPATHQRTTYSFAVAWRLRRAESQVLARNGCAKGDAATRIPVAMGTTLCKKWYPGGVTLAHSLLQRLTIHHIFYKRGWSGPCVETLVDPVLDARGRAYWTSSAAITRGGFVSVQKRRRYYEHRPRSRIAEYSKENGTETGGLTPTVRRRWWCCRARHRNACASRVRRCRWPGSRRCG